jgi:phosphatidylglycerophosphate synthase
MPLEVAQYEHTVKHSTGRFRMSFMKLLRTAAFCTAAVLMAVSLRGFVDIREWQVGASTWVAAMPAMIVAGYFTVGLAAYLVRCLLIGPYRDAETDAREQRIVLGIWVQTWIAWVLRPIWLFLAAAEISPSVVTSFSVLLAAGAGVAMSQEMFGLGGWLYLASGLCDFIDGRLARFTGRITKSGKALDSILDRYSESCMLIGLAFFYRADWMLLAVLLLFAGSYQVSYVRARGEVLGINMTFGLMQRAERVAILGLAAVMSPVVASWTEAGAEPRRYWLMIGTIVFLTVATQFTALVRLLYLLGVLDGETVVEVRGRHRLARLAMLAVVTCAEFALFCSFVEYGAATRAWALTGTVAAGALGLTWVLVRFTATTPPKSFQLAVFVSSSVLLQISGMAIVETIPGIKYVLAWWLVRASILATWSYPLLTQDCDAPPAAELGGKNGYPPAMS